MFFQKRLSAHLRQALKSEDFAGYFQHLKSCQPSLHPFSDAQSMIASFEKGATSNKDQDRILLALIREFQTQPAEHLHNLLLKMFWKGLDHLYRARGKRVDDQEALWNDLVWAFLNVLSDYPVDRLTAKVAANIQMGALKKVTRWAQRENRYQLFSHDPKHPKRTEFEFAELLTCGFTHPNEIFAGRGTPYEPDEDDMARMVDLLKRFRDAGIIGDDALYLLVSTRIYGQSLKEFADRESLSYQAVKKRRQRAEQAIRDHVKKIAPDDVPFSDSKGLYATDLFADEGGPDVRTRNQ